MMMNIRFGRILGYLALFFAIIEMSSCAADNIMDIDTRNGPEWEKAYEDFFLDYNTGYDSGFERDRAEYRLCDLNSDGIPEMFIFPGSADYRENIYTYADGDIIEVMRTSSVIHDMVIPIEGTTYFADLADSSVAYYVNIYKLSANGASSVMTMYDANRTENPESAFEPEYTYIYMGAEVDEATFFAALEHITGIKATPETLFEVL